MRKRPNKALTRGQQRVQEGIKKKSRRGPITGQQAVQEGVSKGSKATVSNDPVQQETQIGIEKRWGREQIQEGVNHRSTTGPGGTSVRGQKCHRTRL